MKDNFDDLSDDFLNENEPAFENRLNMVIGCNTDNTNAG